MEYYDLKIFGEKLRKLRKQNGFNQSDVQRITGIHTDTLRKIENGLVIAKLETLEELSGVYGIDLVQLLLNQRLSPALSNSYNLFDKILISNDFDSLRYDFSNIKELYPKDWYGSKSLAQLQYEKLYIAFEQYIRMDIVSLQNAQIQILELLHLRKINLKTKSLESSYLNLIEIESVLLYAKIKSRLNEIEYSNELINICKIQLKDRNQINLLIICLVNESYNYGKLNMQKKCLSYAIEGIEICQKYSITYCLERLYYRKGIAEYKLSMSNYKVSLKIAYQLIKANKAIH